MRNSVRIIALAAALCMLLTMGVFAAEDGSVWITETDTAEGVSAAIVTDCTVTDGLVTVNYDAQALTYQGLTLNEDCVAMHAVNTDEAGVVRFSWVAPEDAAQEGNEWVVQLHFEGSSEESVEMDGDFGGAEITDAPDINKKELQKAALEAMGLNSTVFTVDTWADVEAALAAVEEVLADPAATQEEIDAAVAALRAAMDALEVAEVPAGEADKSELAKAVAVAEGLQKGNYTEASWKALEKALAQTQAVLADEDATQDEVDAAVAALKAAVAALELNKAADTGDNANLVLPVVLAVVCVAAIVAVLFVMNKKDKGGKAK